jgi:hypothetical protein
VSTLASPGRPSFVVNLYGPNLDITWLKDDSDTDASDLPDPDVLIAEIVEELVAAAQELAAAGSDPFGEASGDSKRGS